MGGSVFSDDSYYKAAMTRAATGASAFAYTDSVRRGATARKVHDKLNPLGVIRESRDSDVHPESTPVAVLFDVTGSMGSVPVTVQCQLPKLMGLLNRKGYIPGPQILIGAVGDAYSDDGPLQVGQFEAGNEIEGDLGSIWIEGNGGGQKSETYELGMYFVSRHTVTDAWEKRKKKGYLFVIGDENHYPAVNRDQVKSLVGDTLEADIPMADLVDELEEKWNVYFIIPNLTSYYNDKAIFNNWSKTLHENVVKLEDPSAICDLIVSLIASNEGVDVDKIESDLAEFGSDSRAIACVSKELKSRGGKEVAIAGSGAGSTVVKF